MLTAEVAVVEERSRLLVVWDYWADSPSWRSGMAGIRGGVDAGERCSWRERIDNRCIVRTDTEIEVVSRWLDLPARRHERCIGGCTLSVSLALNCALAHQI